MCFEPGSLLELQYPLRLNYCKDYVSFPFSNICLPTAVMVARQERTIATYHYEIKGHFQGAISVAQKHEGVLEGSEMVFASDCLQHLSFLPCPISDATCLFISDCSLLFVRWEKGRQEPVQCPPQALENQKWKRLSQLITQINWLCWIINGKYITSMCFVTREQEVGCAPCRGKLSCASIADHLTKQENQSDRLRGSPSVFPC